MLFRGNLNIKNFDVDCFFRKFFSLAEPKTYGILFGLLKCFDFNADIDVSK